MFPCWAPDEEEHHRCSLEEEGQEIRYQRKGGKIKINESLAVRQL